jgi:DNA mismatch repair protein MutS2
LDDAFLTGFSSIRIVHGSGMGVLRRAVSEFLEAHPNVSGFAPAPQNQGGGGATLATLKE